MFGDMRIFPGAGFAGAKPNSKERRLRNDAPENRFPEPAAPPTTQSSGAAKKTMVTNKYMLTLLLMCIVVIRMCL